MPHTLSAFFASLQSIEFAVGLPRRDEMNAILSQSRPAMTAHFGTRTRPTGSFRIDTGGAAVQHSRVKDVMTTMIHAHVLNRRPAGVRSPVDGL